MRHATQEHRAAALAIQRCWRGHVVRRRLKDAMFRKRMRHSFRTRFDDPWSVKSVLLLQRLGRGLILRMGLASGVWGTSLELSRSGRRRSMAGVQRRASLAALIVAPHKQGAAIKPPSRFRRPQRWLPLGYNPPQTEADRSMRLRSLQQQVRVNAAMKLQAWWRARVKEQRLVQHHLRMAGLTYLNMKCIYIQRWWRCVVRQKKFLIPSELDVRAAAEAIVSAEELRIKRGKQSTALRKLWKQDVLHDHSKTHGATDAATRKVLPIANMRSAAAAPPSLIRGAPEPQPVAAIRETPTVSFAAIEDRTAHAGRGVLAPLLIEVASPSQAVERHIHDQSGHTLTNTTVPIVLPPRDVHSTASASRLSSASSLQLLRSSQLHGGPHDPPCATRFLSAEAVALLKKRAEWNQSVHMKTPGWYSKKRS